MSAPTLKVHKGFHLVPRDDGKWSVVDPRFAASRPLHAAADLPSAKRWVSAYREGTTWALQEMYNG